jgi:hypothetical protein
LNSLKSVFNANITFEVVDAIGIEVIIGPFLFWFIYHVSNEVSNDGYDKCLEMIERLVRNNTKQILWEVPWILQPQLSSSPIGLHNGKE